jgi:hypothetical protein
LVVAPQDNKVLLQAYIYRFGHAHKDYPFSPVHSSDQRANWPPYDPTTTAGVSPGFPVPMVFVFVGFAGVKRQRWFVGRRKYP